MSDLWLPDVRVAKIAPRLIDKTGRFTSPLSGNLRTVTRPGDRWGFQLDYQNLAGMDRARLESLVSAQRGAANRLLYSPGDYVQRGSFPSAEALTNNNFSNGTTGWSPFAGSDTLSVSDRVLRVLRGASGTISGVQGAAVPVTQYAPYVLRAMVIAGRSVGNTAAISTQFASSTIFPSSPPGTGLLSPASQVANGATGSITIFDSNASTGIAGDYFSVPWASLSRCMLVDNGANMLLWSDQLNNAAWTQGATTTTATAATAPDGTNTGCAIADTAANGAHFVSQSTTQPSSAADFSLCVALKQGAKNWAFLGLYDGVNNAYAYFDLNAGVAGSTAVGANWANARSFITPLGNGWYFCCLTARKTAATTTVSPQIGPASANGATGYAGAATTATYAWRATMAQSSVPVRLVQSVGASVAAIAQTGSALYIKGLPASTNGLLLPGDWIEVNKEIKKVTAALNSDASGLGYLQFSPPLRNPPADNDPVIVNTPMGRFVFSATENGWSAVPPYFASSTFDLVEAL